jgi:phosphoacetylglucosamine mutase
LHVDCANGVGAIAASELQKHLAGSLQLNLGNDDYRTPGKLNNDCGADYVKTMQKLPPSLDNVLVPGQRGCSLDGDADRLIYYYLDHRRQFRMLDGDKIAALIAAFIGELVKSAGLESEVKVGVVQTAYANGASTKYLAEVCYTRYKFDHFYLKPIAAFASKMCFNWSEAPSSCGRTLQYWSLF